VRNYTFFKNIFEEVIIKCIDLDIIIIVVKRKKISARLDENYFNQSFYGSKYEELKYSVFNLLIIKGISIIFNQDSLDLINAVINLLKFQLNNSFSKYFM
jgi:hypothetical protein